MDYQGTGISMRAFYNATDAPGTVVRKIRPASERATAALNLTWRDLLR